MQAVADAPPVAAPLLTVHVLHDLLDVLVVQCKLPEVLFNNNPERSYNTVRCIHCHFGLCCGRDWKDCVGEVEAFGGDFTPSQKAEGNVSLFLLLCLLYLCRQVYWCS